MLGTPGEKSSLVLRTGQFLFAGASFGVMTAATGCSSSTAFCYLIAAMGILCLWSFILASYDLLAMKLDLVHEYNPTVITISVVGDWIISLLSLGAASSSAAVVFFFSKETNFCHLNPHLSCGLFQISISLAFVAWLLLVVSSHIMFWLASTAATAL